MESGKDRKRNYWLYLYNLLVVLCLGYLLYNSSETNRITYVDSAKLFSEYKGATKAKEAYREKVKQYQQNIDTLTAEVEASIKRYEAHLSVINVKQQEQEKEEINSKQKELARYQLAAKEKMGKEESALMADVIKELNQYLQEYGKQHRLKLILIANPAGTIAYAQEGLDVTDDVLAELNKAYSK